MASSARSSRRTLVVAGAAVALVVVVAGAAAALGSLVESPGEAAARSRPPRLTPITVPVEQKVLRDTVTVYGVVAAERTFDVVVRGFAVPRADPLVTSTPLRRGDRVRPGAVMIEVGGRPVVAVPGPVPLYRDIVPDDSGADVSELQDALRAAGHGVSDRRGRYGRSTASALTALYRGLGYPSPPDVAATPRAPGRAATVRGPLVPRSEFAAVPRGAMRVGTVVAHVGATADGPLLRLAGGRAVLRADLGPGEAELVHVGDAAVTSVDGRDLTGRVSSLRDQTAPAGTGAGSSTVATITLDRSLGVARDDQELRVDIVVASTKHPVLVVPSSTVRSDDSGGTTVVLAADRRRVPVHLGLTAGGLVEVVPVGERLRPGDEVLVGVP